MNKKAFKQEKEICELSGEVMPEIPELKDTDRIKPKADGGIYDKKNTRVVLPIEHMKRHGTLRERETDIDLLKSLIDDRQQIIKLVNKINNQILAYNRMTDNPSEFSISILNETLEKPAEYRKALDREIVKLLKQMRKTDKLIDAAMNIKGVGEITVAYLTTYIELDGKYPDDYTKDPKRAGTERCPHPSSIWAYCGYDKASHERYTKGIAGGGNKTLRTILFNTAESMIKSKSPYTEVYYNHKHRLELSEKITKSRNTQGKLIECMWKDTKPGHRHGSAMRVMIKHFLADYWFVGRTLKGLSTRPLYVEEYLGHTGIIKPEERGWKF